MKEAILPTIEELQDAGYDQREIESGIKHGLIKKPEEGEEKKEEEEKEKQPEDGDVEETKEAKSDEGDERDSKEEAEGSEESEEQEAESEKDNLSKYNANEKALYWKAKEEKIKRQRIEATEQQLRIKQKLLEEENLKLKEEAKSKLSKDNVSDEDLDTDEYGRVNMTPEKLNEMINKATEATAEKIINSIEKKESDKKKLDDDQVLYRNECEAKAQQDYDDFDEISELGADLIEANLNGPDHRRLMRSIQEMNRNEGETAADVLYEIGLKAKAKGYKLKESKSAAPKSKDGERIINNSKKRKSSAAVAGGGQKTISPYEEMGWEEAGLLPPEEFMKIPKKHRLRILKEMEEAR